MNAVLTQATDDDIRSENNLTTPKNSLLPSDMLELKGVSVSCRLEPLPTEHFPWSPKLAADEACSILSFNGLDMTGILLFACALLKKYDLNVVQSHGAQMGNGQNSGLLACGKKANLEKLCADIKQHKERYTLDGFKFSPQMYYRLVFTCQDAMGLMLRLMELLVGPRSRYNLNIESFATRNDENGEYAVLNMRLEVPKGVTREDMTLLSEELNKLSRSATAELHEEL